MTEKELAEILCKMVDAIAVAPGPLHSKLTRLASMYTDRLIELRGGVQTAS